MVHGIQAVSFSEFPDTKIIVWRRLLLLTFFSVLVCKKVYSLSLYVYISLSLSLFKNKIIVFIVKFGMNTSFPA